MDKADGLGTGVAVVGHVALFGALSLGLAASIPPRPVPPPAMEVEFVDTVALEAVAAPSTEAMAQAEAPEVGTPEEAMPQPAPVPEPLPPAPRPEPVAAPPVPAPPKPPEPKPPEPRRARPAPKPAPVKKVVAKPQKAAPVKQAVAKAAPAKPAPQRTASNKNASTKTATAKASGAGTKTAARAPRLGKNFLAGLSDPSPGKADKPQAPVMSAKATADIGSAIKRQVEPCAKRQALAGSGVDRIRVTIRLQLNRDGSLAARPTVTGATGVDDENSRYAARVNDLAIAAFTGCAPLRGLPADLYDVKRGWKNFSLRFSLPARG